MNRRLRCALSALLFIAIAVVARAAPPTLSLDEAIERALDEAPQVMASAANVQAAEAIAPSAGRFPDPEFVTGVENLPIDTVDRFSFTRDFMTMRKIGLLQSFPNSAKRRWQTERAS